MKNLLAFLATSFKYLTPGSPKEPQRNFVTHKDDGRDIRRNCTPRSAHSPVSAHSEPRDKSAHSGRHAARKAAARSRASFSQQPKAPRVQRRRQGTQDVAAKGSLSLGRLTIHGKGV